MWFTVCSDRGPYVAIHLFRLCLWLKLPVGRMTFQSFDGDGDDVDSDSDRAETCWKSILVRSRTLLQSHCPGVELQHGACQNFVSLKTYTWDHTFSGPRSDARSDTPRYPERYLKSMKLGSTPHGHLKLYNLCYTWNNMGSMNKGTLKFLLG